MNTAPSPYTVNGVEGLLRHAKMSASYKPALLRALVAYALHNTQDEVPLPVLGGRFARMYWNQTVIYHLRQAASLSGESEVIKLIRAASERFSARLFQDVPVAEQERIALRMAHVLKINLLAAFHVSKPAGMPDLYYWNPDEEYLRLLPGARQFLKENTTALQTIANFYWAMFLEKTNRLAPRINQKVSRDAAIRASLRKYVGILMQDAPRCFYCEIDLGVSNAEVDHVIPWSFVLEDDLWNLVLACTTCNSAKSDWLPTTEFISKLIARNIAAVKNPKMSMLIHEDQVRNIYDAAISVEWPHPWSPD